MFVLSKPAQTQALQLTNKQKSQDRSHCFQYSARYTGLPSSLHTLSRSDGTPKGLKGNHGNTVFLVATTRVGGTPPLSPWPSDSNDTDTGDSDTARRNTPDEQCGSMTSSMSRATPAQSVLKYKKPPVSRRLTTRAARSGCRMRLRLVFVLAQGSGN